MKKIIKTLIIIFLIAIFCFPSVGVANNNSGGEATGGEPGKVGQTCPDCSWSYNTIGVRFSLYKYDGKDLTYYGSADYCVENCNKDGYSYGKPFQAKKAGKVAYQNKSAYNVNARWIKDNVNFISQDTFDLDAKKSLMGKGFVDSGLNDKIRDFLKLDSGSNSEILTQIEQLLSKKNIVTSSELNSLYITVEPTLGIKNSNNNNRYYGTAYELNSYFSDGANLNEINDQVYVSIGKIIMASNISGSDNRHFVGDGDDDLIKVVDPALGNPWNGETTRKNNASEITSNSGYGIAVYWLGDYADPTPSCTISESNNGTTYTLQVSNPGGDTIYYDISNKTSNLRHDVQNTSYSAGFKDTTIVGKIYNSNGNEVATCSASRSVPTCEQTCTGKTGDNLLGCAENYCQVMTDNSSDKKSCIKSCGYQPPGGGDSEEFTNCGTYSNLDGDDTECDQSTTSDKKTCTKATTNNYFKTVCTDESTISYGSSLPVMINPGLGFTYTPTVSGSKVCQMTFESEKWKFDYAGSYTQDERDKLIGILNRYNNVSDNSMWAKDENNLYNYKSNDANIEIQITKDNNPSAASKYETKKLIADNTTNLLDKKIVVSSGGTVTIPLYANGNKTTKTIFKIIETSSSNKTTYKLPGLCIKSGDGSLYDLGPSGNCETSNEGPYYKYFTDLQIENGNYNTKTIVTKSNSNLDVENTCYYDVVDSSNTPVSCSIVVTDCNNNKPEKAELRIENNSNLNVSYGLSSNGYTLNGVKQLSVNNSIKELYGAVGIDGRIVATCSKDLTATVCDPTGDGDSNCRATYKPAEYSKIKSYCESNWMNDTDSYSSEKDCYNSCSSYSNTCKYNSSVDRNDRDSVEAFCSIKKNRDDNGYNQTNDANHNIAMCVNDCYIPGGNPPPPPGDDPPGGSDDTPCLGMVCNYLYRPISLNDPFPNNRDAGPNWYGKEIFITDDLLNPLLNSGSEPEYVIELTPEAIDLINKDTDSYNRGKNKNVYIDYIYNDNENKEGKYISKFIHKNDENGGGFNKYFTRILN